MEKLHFLDSHAHIFDDYEADPDLTVKEAITEGVKTIMNAGIDVDTSKKAVEVAKRNNLFAAVGVHPTYELKNSHLDELEKLIKANKNIIAIGEIGLDYYHIGEKGVPDREHQKKNLAKQFELAAKYKLPVLIHCREAIDDLYDLLLSFKGKITKGIMHTFAGNTEQAKRFIELGFYISFSGVVTFKNAKPTQKMAQELPLEWMLTETDSPYLTPHPFRGKKNHTKNVVYVAKKIAELRGIDLKTVTEQILKNFKTLFNLK